MRTREKSALFLSSAAAAKGGSEFVLLTSRGLVVYIYTVRFRIVEKSSNYSKFREGPKIL